MPRYASIWFPLLLAEYTVRKKPEFRDVPFVIANVERGRMVIEAANVHAMQKGIRTGMVLADCKAILPELQMIVSEPGRAEKLLHALADWCIRYTPFAAVDLPDGIILDTTGCTHLWGGETAYLENIKAKLATFGYTVRAAIADTIGAAWAMARFGNECIVTPKKHPQTLRHLPVAALRIDAAILTKLKKLGLQRIDNIIDMPSSVLRRRFGPSLPLRIGQVLGSEIEKIVPIKPIAPYQERLSCLEPICTATGITMALQQLLDTLCVRFAAEGIGLRTAVLKAYRIDDNIQQIEIGTGQPSRNARHLFRLFEHKIGTLQPDLGFELFVLEAPKVETITEEQVAIWNAVSHNDMKIAELLDRVTAKTSSTIKRYLPDEHYWPERSVKEASPLWEKPAAPWRIDLPRPIHLLPKPESIDVMAVLPDYPPRQFRHKNKWFSVAKSDGPERIEQEWWLTDGLFRDYYCIEDENGARYWLFRCGPYDAGRPEWFLHGYFA